MVVRILAVLTLSCFGFDVSVLSANEQPAHDLTEPPTSKDGAPMIVVPAGLFPMGVPAGARDGGRDEYPRHDVFVDTFMIDKF